MKQYDSQLVYVVVDLESEPITLEASQLIKYNEI